MYIKKNNNGVTGAGLQRNISNDVGAGALIGILNNSYKNAITNNIKFHINRI